MPTKNKVSKKSPRKSPTSKLKDEIKLEKERTKDLKLFLRKEQAILRKEQAERQRRFLEELKLDKQIQKFRVREVKELEKLDFTWFEAPLPDYDFAGYKKITNVEDFRKIEL